MGITKIFTLSPHFEELRWLAGGLACGAVSAVMTLTKTIYPPAGATALLAAIDPTVQQLGWYLVPLVLLSTCLTLIVSLIINNIQRRYPTYWWTPVDLAKGARGKDIEKVSSSNGSGAFGDDPKRYSKQVEVEGEHTILITTERIVVPGYMLLACEEKEILEILRNRLGQGLVKQPDSESDV